SDRVLYYSVMKFSPAPRRADEIPSMSSGMILRRRRKSRWPSHIFLRFIPVCEQLAGINFERPSKLTDVIDGNIALPAFNRTNIGAVDARSICECFLREAYAFAKPPDARGPDDGFV